MAGQICKLYFFQRRVCWLQRAVAVGEETLFDDASIVLAPNLCPTLNPDVLNPTNLRPLFAPYCPFQFCPKESVAIFWSKARGEGLRDIAGICLEFL